MYQEFEVKISSGESLKGCYWPAKEPKRIIVMQTGMNEHASRYEEMAAFLNGKGISIYILDAFGQGLNATSIEEQERWPVDGFFKNVEAMNVQLLKVKEESKLPVVIMGHSMGSFMTQSYIERYPGSADKVVLFGTNGPTKIYGLANLMGKMLVNKKNWDKPSPTLQNLALGGYTKAIKNRKTDLDWLSYNEENVNRYIEDPYCGHDNTGGFFRGFFAGLATLYKKKNLKKIDKEAPVLIAAGEEDPVGVNGKGPKNLAKLYKKLGLKDVNLILYKNMRHEIHNEDEREKVFNDLADFVLK